MFSLSFWKNLNRWIAWIALAVLFGLTILVTNIEIKDVDLWLHLASGRQILKTLTVPALDFLSFTINNKEWINHEWLFQILTQLSYQTFGAGGLINIRVVVVTMILILLVMIGYNERRLGLTVFLLFVVLQTFMLRIQLRPDMFSVLYLILFIYTLAAQIGQRSSLVILFVIQVLWVNTHGFFIFAPVLVFLMVAAEWLKRHVKLPYAWNAVGRYSDEEFRRLGWALGLVVLACFVNPHPVQGALYPLRVLTSLGGDSAVFFAHIKELERPIRWDNLLAFSQNWPYRLMIVLSGASFALNRKRLDIGMFVLWIIFLLFSLSALRNMIFFSVVAYLVILINFQHIQWRKIFSPILPRPQLPGNARLPFFCVNQGRQHQSLGVPRIMEQDSLHLRFSLIQLPKMKKTHPEIITDLIVPAVDQQAIAQDRKSLGVFPLHDRNLPQDLQGDRIVGQNAQRLKGFRLGLIQKSHIKKGLGALNVLIGDHPFGRNRNNIDFRRFVRIQINGKLVNPGTVLRNIPQENGRVKIEIHQHPFGIVIQMADEPGRGRFLNGVQKGSGNIVFSDMFLKKRFVAAPYFEIGLKIIRAVDLRPAVHVDPDIRMRAA